MRFQINVNLNTIRYGKPDKKTVARHNRQDGWHTVEGTPERLTDELKAGNTVRLCEKRDGNSKEDIVGVCGLGLDIDFGDFSVSKTLNHPLLSQVSYIYYKSFSGVPGEDRTPHRLIFPFSKDLTDVAMAERVDKALHKIFTDYNNGTPSKSFSTFDAGRLWFATSAQNLDTIIYVDNGKYLDEAFSTSVENVEESENYSGYKKSAVMVKTETNGKGSTSVLDLISQVSATPDKPKNTTKTKTKKGTTLRDKLDGFWAEYTQSGGDINAAITKIVGYDMMYKLSSRTQKNGDVFQLDGGHWDGSLATGVIRPDSDSTTLTLKEDGLIYFYSRRDGFGCGLTSFLFTAYTAKKNRESIAAIKVSNGELLKFTNDRCECLGIEGPKFSLNAEEIWEFYIADSKGKVYYMPQIRSYAVYGKHSHAIVDSIGTDYKDRVREYQYHWSLVAAKDLVESVDQWNINTFGHPCAAKLLKDLKTLAELGTSQVDKLTEFPIDCVLPVKGNKLWHFNRQEIVEATHEYFYWNPSTMPFLQGDKEEEIGKDFVNLIKLITPEKEHFKIPHVLDWFTLWLAGRAYSTQFAMYLWGEGGAGKSTICQWLRAMVGGDLVETRENSLLRPDLRFGNERLLQTTRTLFNEFKGDNIKNGNLPFLKDLIAASKSAVIDANGCVVPGVYTGGTSIEVEIKFGGQSTGLARLGVLMNGQNLPVVPENDEGWPRRFLFLEFRLAKERTDLFDKISSYLPYLRSWLLKRDLRQCEKNLEAYIRSPNTLQANRSLLHGNSPMGQFIESYIELTPNDYSTPFSELYNVWSNYCELQKIRPGSIGNFLANLTASLKAMGLLTGDAQLVEERRDDNRNKKKYLMLQILSH